MASPVPLNADVTKQPWPEEWYAVFLRELRATGNVGQSAAAAGVSRHHTYHTRARYPRFRDAWDGCLEDATDELEAEARRRAMNGSDFLLWKMLSSLRRRVYGEKVAIDINLRERIAVLAAQHQLDPKEVMDEMDALMAGIDQLEAAAIVGQSSEQGDNVIEGEAVEVPPCR